MLNHSGIDISVVVQGPISEVTKSCISSIRNFLPESTIIVSTDETADVTEINYDHLVLNKDVGAKYSADLGGKKPNNVNRQITSTLNGLKAVKTKYALKLRSDFILTGNSFLDYFQKYQHFNEQEKYFEQRILACTIFSKLPKKSKFIEMSGSGYPYHLSDFVQFGLTKDLLKLWNVDLVSDEDLNWFDKPTEEYVRHRYNAEQQIFVQFMKKNNIAYFADHFHDRNEKNSKHTDLIMANNFVLLPFEKFCLQPTKDLFKLGFNHYYTASYMLCYTHRDWLKAYKQYCDPKVKIGLIDWDYLRYFKFNWPWILKVERNYLKLKNHAKSIFSPQENIPSRLKEICLSIFYLTKFLTKLLFKLITISINFLR